MLKIIFILLLPLLGQTTGTEQQNGLPENKQLILINLTKRTLEFYDQDKIIFKCRIRVGKRGTPTPVGSGYVYEKRERPVFRYVDPGPQQGEVINYAECADGLKKVVHSKMRALGIRIKNTDRYSIHSTTCSETIGKPLSNGCIGMTVQDMLKLYPLVQDKTIVKIIK
ncbi:MAG: L,D-transpeptidase [Candidatus Yanofskybacteria bacterium]|nr:L,D-transpeptidase [Candidatus Yanofskybacteria bacterium]